VILDDVRKYYQKTFGKPARVASFQLGGHEIEVQKWGADRNREQVDLYATIGASAHAAPDRDAGHRSEFFVGLKPGVDDVARPLTMLALQAIIERTSLEHGHSVSFPEPLWSGTTMTSFLVLRPMSEIIRPLPLEGGVHVEFLQAIPLFQSEIAFKAEHGAEELIRRWQSVGLAFWDPARSPEPGSIQC
jgi:hypothetical protein